MITKTSSHSGKNEKYIEFLRSRISPNIKPEVADLMVEYALTPEEHQETLSRIEDYCFVNKSPVPKPKLYVVVSQAGGGKSTLVPEILKSNENVVVISSDYFKSFNPKQEEILKTHPTLYGHLTGLDSYLHKEEIFKKALEGSYNILISVAPSTKETLFGLNFEEPLKHGYKININCLAVSNINSLLSIHERYERQLELNLKAPKLTDLKRALDSYDAIKQTLKYLVSLPCTNINVWKRGEFNLKNISAPVFLTSEKDKAIKVYDQAIEQDKVETIMLAKSRIAGIKDKMKKRNAPKEQLAQLEKIEQLIKYAKLSSK